MRAPDDSEGGMKTKVAETGELQDGRALCRTVSGIKLVLIRDQSRVFAIENKCPHLGLPLGRGKIENGQIVCPFHGSRFDIRTGENSDWVSSFAGMTIPPWSRGLLSMGKKPQPVKIFAVSVENNDVLVEL
jgi:nitrite reductase/ring-hydroxylating ferredoxin subunit